MEIKEKERGESLRITRTLIWLFYPLAWQRTKCIDSSAIAPPVSGMYFIHPTAKTQCIYGHHANESTFLVIGKRKEQFWSTWEVTRLKGIYILKKGKAYVYRYLLSSIWPAKDAWERDEEKSMKRSEFKWKTGIFFSLVSCPYKAADIHDGANDGESSLIIRWEFNRFDRLKK